VRTRFQERKLNQLKADYPQLGELFYQPSVKL